MSAWTPRCSMRGGPESALAPRRDSRIAEAMRSANNPRAACVLLPSLVSIRLSHRPGSDPCSTTKCQVEISLDTALRVVWSLPLRSWSEVRPRQPRDFGSVVLACLFDQPVGNLQVGHSVCKLCVSQQC